MTVETELALKESKDAVFDSNGEARLRFNPTGSGERWIVELYTVFVVTGTTRCWLYRNSEDTPPLDFTRQGSGDASVLGSFQMRQGEELVFVWKDGTTGVRAQARVEGKRFIPGRRAY